MQTFQTKIFLTLADDFSARTASELCRRGDHDARVSLLTGNALSHRANIKTSKSYNTQKDFRFDRGFSLSCGTLSRSLSATTASTRFHRPTATSSPTTTTRTSRTSSSSTKECCDEWIRNDPAVPQTHRTPHGQRTRPRVHRARWLRRARSLNLDWRAISDRCSEEYRPAFGR